MKWAIASAVMALLSVFSAPAVSSAEDQKYESLMKNLTDLNGWEAETANGMEVGDGAGTIIIVMRDYRSGNKLIHTQIVVGKSAKRAWSQYEQGGTIDTPALFSTTTKAGDHKIGINHEKKTNTGSIVVPLNVKEGNAIFSLAFVGLSYEEALNIAKLFPWKSMEATIDKK